MEAKHVRDLMEAYSSVYVQPEEPIDEDFQKTVKDTLEAGANLVRTNPVLGAATSVIAPVGQGRKTPTKDGKWRPTGVVAKEDVFDVIKGHLLDEGYADTEEAALAIMANMSEEWKQSILNEDPVQDYRDRVRKKENEAGLRGPEFELTHSVQPKVNKGKPQPGSSSQSSRGREFTNPPS